MSEWLATSSIQGVTIDYPEGMDSLWCDVGFKFQHKKASETRV